MIGASGWLVLFSIFLYILVHINRLSVAIAWVFFLATRFTTVSLDEVLFKYIVQLDCLTLQQLITGFDDSWGPEDVTGFAVHLQSPPVLCIVETLTKNKKLHPYKHLKNNCTHNFYIFETKFFSIYKYCSKVTKAQLVCWAYCKCGIMEFHDLLYTLFRSC